MRRLIATIAVAVVVPFTFAVSPAYADCRDDRLSENEWDQIEIGMLRRVVHDIIGGNGVEGETFTQGDDYKYKIHAYQRCNGEWSSILYRDWEGGDVVWRAYQKTR